MKPKERYVTSKVVNIITQIAIQTDIPGYTIGVIEAFIPEVNELTREQEYKWIKENNKRMTAICKFLNENNL